MNLNIVKLFTIIGIILSIAASAYSQEMCAQVVTCDQCGKPYPTPCAFEDAQKKNPTLRQAPCPPQSG